MTRPCSGLGQWSLEISMIPELPDCATAWQVGAMSVDAIRKIMLNQQFGASFASFARPRCRWRLPLTRRPPSL